MKIGDTGKVYEHKAQDDVVVVYVLSERMAIVKKVYSGNTYIVLSTEDPNKFRHLGYYDLMTENEQAKLNAWSGPASIKELMSHPDSE